MLDKRPSEHPGAVLVTFKLPSHIAGTAVYLVGDFNDWSTSAHPMGRTSEGYVAQVALEAGRSYRFRYLVDGGHWENDWAADGYAPNEFGGDDSVVDLTDYIAADVRQEQDDPSTDSASTPPNRS